MPVCICRKGSLSVLTRTEHRSKAVQIGMNLVVLEEWIEDMGLPRGIASHLTPVRDLLNWLQVRSQSSNLRYCPLNVTIIVPVINYRFFQSGGHHTDNEEY
jgi:hypothetical protein